MEESVCGWGSVSVWEWCMVHIWCTGCVCDMGDSANAVCVVNVRVLCVCMYLSVCMHTCAAWCVWVCVYGVHLCEMHVECVSVMGVCWCYVWCVVCM